MPDLTVHVVVTADHITRALPNAYECPIALALQDLAAIESGEDSIEVDGERVDCRAWDGRAYHAASALLPAEAQAFVDLFDNGYLAGIHPAPIDFDLKINFIER